MESVFSYTNYRKYLADRYDFLKKNTTYFSFRYFSKKAGFSSPSQLKFIINGERNLSPEGVEKFIIALDLNKKESDYFRALVSFNQAKTERLKNACFKELLKHSNDGAIKLMNKKQFEVYESWHHIPIRELVSLPAFREDPAWIARSLTPPIKPAEAARSLELLKSLGFLKYDAKGKLAASDPFISTGDEVQSLLIRNFHRHMIQLAGESLERFPKEEREISSVTVSVSDKSFREIKTRISAFEDELLEWLAREEGPAEHVYQLNFQLFPIARTGGDHRHD